MTSIKDALALLSDIEKFAEKGEFPKAESLIARARDALEIDTRRWSTSKVPEQKIRHG